MDFVKAEEQHRPVQAESQYFKPQANTRKGGNLEVLLNAQGYLLISANQHHEPQQAKSRRPSEANSLDGPAICTTEVGFGNITK